MPASSKKYKCIVCGYIYNPEDGDIPNDIEQGVEFDNIPESWMCPLCGADKSFFNETED